MIRSIVLFSVVALLAAPCWAQDTADVLGTVRDASGAAVPNATVTILNQDTGIQASKLSDANGDYLFTYVKIGSYTISAEATGFGKATVLGVTVNVNARQRVDIKLTNEATTTQAAAGAAGIQTDSSESSRLVNKRQATELPLNGRNYSDLALVTGVTRSPNGLGGGRPREGSFAVNGLRATFNSFVLDGTDNNCYATSVQGGSSQVTSPPPDSIAEFRIITNNYTADYGRSGGAVINVVTKSGGNQLHGTAYDFMRNTVLNTAGYQFGVRPATWKKPVLQQNQFGASLSGPLIKNRAFFFAAYEGLRSITKTLSFITIPTMDDRKGIFPIAVRNPQTGKVYPAGSGIPLSDMPYYAQLVISQWPVPNGPGRANNYQELLPTRTPSDKYDARIDFQINPEMSTFARWSQRKQNSKSLSYDSELFTGRRSYILNQQLVGGYTWNVNPSTIFEARFGYSRVDGLSMPNWVGDTSLAAGTMYHIPGLITDPQWTGGMVGSIFNQFATVGRSGASPQWQNPKHYNPKVNFTKILGRHNLKMGYEFVTISESVMDINPIYGGDYYQGQFSKMPGGPTDANSLGTYSLVDFMFGLRNRYMMSAFNVIDIEREFDFAYLNDDFRPADNLTLNLGVRWEYTQPWVDPNDRMANFDPTTNTIRYAKPGGTTAERALVNPDYKNFGPRFGFAYRPFAKTVVRGGYGISYVHEHRVGSQEELNIFGPNGVVTTIDQSNPLDPSFRPTQLGYPVDMVDPSKFDPSKANITYIPPDVKTAYVQSWALNIQRELTKNLVFEIGYVGNRGLALPLFADYNQASPQPTPTSNLPLQARRPLKNFSAITWWNDAGWSNYHGMQAKIERQFSGGFSFIDTFTWAHTMDNSTQCLDTSNGNNASPQDVRNLAAEKGPSNTDQRLTSVTSFIYELPVGRGRRFMANSHPIVDRVMGGWRMNMIMNALSAMPINLRSWIGNIPAAFQTVGNLNDWRGGETFRPNVIGEVLNTTPGVDKTENYFNKANVVLQTDPSQPFGNAGRNSTRATGMFTIDFGLFKEFALPREGMRLQFRSEFFNLTNRTNFTGANSDRASAAFGTVRSTLAPRQIQFALKLVF